LEADICFTIAIIVKLALLHIYYGLRGKEIMYYQQLKPLKITLAMNVMITNITEIENLTG